MSTNPISNPKVAAELGEKIYRERYKDEYERDHAGKFVAINVLNQETYIGATPEEVLDRAHTSAPTGIFHLIQVGHAGAFRVSYSSHNQNQTLDWIFR